MTTWITTKRKMIGLSQTEVAVALGVSRPTYKAIENGARKPTEVQKNILAHILEQDNVVFSREAERDHSAVKPNIIVRKKPVENVEKFKQTLLYILNKVGSRSNIGQTAIYKLLYFIDFDYYEKYEKPLIGATYIRNTFGPTPTSFAKIVKDMERAGELVTVKSKHFDYDQTKYVPTIEANLSILDGQELKHIDDELERFAKKSAKDLSELSHLDTPWRVAGNKEILDYEHVFYRSKETSVRTYEPL